ncbi:MAG: hypothetical protein JO363_06520 [Solirubrobacterales bacterium]|nr:hypothetical protein [Solirubrobacterales bacterium]
MVGLQHIVHVQRRVEREFLVGVDIDHGSLAERVLQPDANRTVGVLATPATATRRFLVIVVAALVVIVGIAEEYSNLDLVVSLVHDDLAHALVTAKRDAKLELADVPLSEAERMT